MSNAADARYSDLLANALNRKTKVHTLAKGLGFVCKNDMGSISRKHSTFATLQVEMSEMADLLANEYPSAKELRTAMSKDLYEDVTDPFMLGIVQEIWIKKEQGRVIGGDLVWTNPADAIRIADNIFKWVIKRFQAAVKTSRTAKESIEESQPFTRLRAGNTKRKMSSHVARNYGSFAPGPTVTQDPLTPIESDSGCPDTFEEDDFDFVLFYEPDPQPSSNFRAPEAEMISRTHQVGNSSEITTSESHPDEAGPSMQTRSKRTRAAGAGDDDLEIIKHLKHRRMDTTDTHENLVPPAIDDARINSTSTGPLNLNPVRTSLPCRLSERVGSIDGLPRSPRINPINPESGESTNQMETENSNIGNGNGSLRAPGLDSGVVGRPCLQPAAPTETHADATGERSVDEENRQSTFSESAGTESTLEHDRLLLRSKLLNDMSPTEGQSDPANEALELVKGTLEKYKEQLTTTAGIDYRTDREKLTELMDSNEAARQFRTKIHYRGTYEDWRTEANAPGNHARFHELVRCLSEAQISWRSAHPDLRLSQLKIEVGRMLYAVADFGALGLGVQFVTDQIVELLSGDTQDWLEGPRKRNEHGCEEVM